MVVEVAVAKVEIVVVVFAVIVAVAVWVVAFFANLVDTCCYYWKSVAEASENFG